jgi:hypothetical protein
MPFWNKSTEILEQLNCYETIDELPIKLWFDVHKTGNYGLLLKDIREVNTEELKQLFETWEKIYNQYIERFGLSPEFLEDLELQMEIAKEKAEFIITGQRHLRTMYRIKEEELASNQKGTQEPLELEALLAKMSKHYGFKLNSQELTTAQYYGYLKSVKNG